MALFDSRRAVPMSNHSVIDTVRKRFLRSAEFSKPSSKEASLGLKVDVLQRLPVSRCGLILPAYTPQEIAAHSRQHVVPVEFTAFRD